MKGFHDMQSSISAKLVAVLAFISFVHAATPARAIEVGDVFWLSSSGVSRTVVATAISQPGVVRVEYKTLSDNASEYCQRYGQKKVGSPELNSCVAETIRGAKTEVALVNCRSRVLVLDYGSFEKGTDHFWWSKTDKNSFVLGDDLFNRSCIGVR